MHKYYNNKVIHIFFFLFFFLFDASVYGYVDPGMGGYLVSQIGILIMSAFIFLFAGILFFMRRYVFRFIKRVCAVVYRYYIYFGLGIAVALACVIYVNPNGKKDPKADLNAYGVGIYDSQRIAPGYNIFSYGVFDIEGKVVKWWHRNGVRCELPLFAIDRDGDYYAKVSVGKKKYGWGRYTWSGEVVWEKDEGVHHEIILSPWDTVFTFGREVHEYKGRLVEFDIILEYDKNGKELSRFSLWEHLSKFQQYHKKFAIDVPFPSFVDMTKTSDPMGWGGDYDYYHLNSLSFVVESPLQGKHPAFEPGNLVINFRHGGMVFILDKQTKEILWSCVDDDVRHSIDGQHAAQLLPTGTLLMFDNGWLRKWSRVIEINPLNYDIVWEYRHTGFYSGEQGYVQRLENGNTLITDSCNDRVFEVTPDKEIVWEYYTPFFIDESKEKKLGSRKLLYRMYRYPTDMIEPLLEVQ